MLSSSLSFMNLPWDQIMLLNYYIHFSWTCNYFFVCFLYTMVYPLGRSKINPIETALLFNIVLNFILPAFTFCIYMWLIIIINDHLPDSNSGCHEEFHGCKSADEPNQLLKDWVTYDDCKCTYNNQPRNYPKCIMTPLVMKFGGACFPNKVFESWSVKVVHWCHLHLSCISFRSSWKPISSKDSRKLLHTVE